MALICDALFSLNRLTYRLLKICKKVRYERVQDKESCFKEPLFFRITLRYLLAITEPIRFKYLEFRIAENLKKMLPLYR